MRILLDKDQVLADFVGGACAAHGVSPGLVMRHWEPGVYSMTTALSRAKGRTGTMSEGDFWRPIHALRGFWRDLAPLPWAGHLLNLVRDITPDWYIVTAPSLCRECVAEKRDWLADRYGDEYADRMVPTKHKELMAVTRDGPAVLVDDSESNCERFRAAGGTAIVFPAHNNSLHGLKDDPVEYVEHRLAELRKRGTV